MTPMCLIRRFAKSWFYPDHETDLSANVPRGPDKLRVEGRKKRLNRFFLKVIKASEQIDCATIVWNSIFEMYAH